MSSDIKILKINHNPWSKEYPYVNYHTKNERPTPAKPVSIDWNVLDLGDIVEIIFSKTEEERDSKYVYFKNQLTTAARFSGFKIRCKKLYSWQGYGLVFEVEGYYE